MRSWKALARLIGPKPANLGPRLFASDFAIINHCDRTVANASENAREWLRDRPGLTDEQLADKLFEAARLTPLTISPPFSIEVECAAVPFRGGDPVYYHRATVRVPYLGSAVLWSHQLEPGFDSELNGKAGVTTMRLKSVLLDENPAPFKEHVDERLDAVHERLHRHASGIAAMNEYLDKELRGWAAANPATIEKLRQKSAKPGR